MTVFRAAPFNGDFGRAMWIEDERSGETWEEPIDGWSEIWEIDTTRPPEVSGGRNIRAASFDGQRYYRHKDGRVAVPA